VRDQILGCILGGAIGDAFGSAYEGRRAPVVISEANEWRLSVVPVMSSNPFPWLCAARAAL